MKANLLRTGEYGVEIIGGFILAELHSTGIAVSFLLVMMVLDYITRLVCEWWKSKHNVPGSGLSSQKGLDGIVKKFGIFMMVIVGMGLDFVAAYLLNGGNTPEEFTYRFGTIITLWYIVNEIISIMENVSEMDGKVPKFLKDKLLNYQERVEKWGD